MYIKPMPDMNYFNQTIKEVRQNRENMKEETEKIREMIRSLMNKLRTGQRLSDTEMEILLESAPEVHGKVMEMINQVPDNIEWRA